MEAVGAIKAICVHIWFVDDTLSPSASYYSVIECALLVASHPIQGGVSFLVGTIAFRIMIFKLLDGSIFCHIMIRLS